MINIDLTTNSTVYNTLGAQSQWIQHRFGRRNYPNLDLDADIVIKTLNKLTGPIQFISIFGEPCAHPNFLEILKTADVGRTVINTTLNFVNDRIIEELNNKKTFVVVPLYGINELCDKIVLNSDWTTISNNLKKLNTSVSVEFYLFEHNIHQLEEVKEFCKDTNCDLKINKGVSIHPSGFSTIVDEQGEWLYDVYSCNQTSTIKWDKLHKTVNGYNSLIQFVKPIKGKSILEKPLVYPFTQDYSYDKDISISVTGDVFPSFELHKMFSNALCDDWNLSIKNIADIDQVTINESFKYVCSSINKILTYLKSNNNIYNKDIDSILTDLANSNI